MVNSKIKTDIGFKTSYILEELNRICLKRGLTVGKHILNTTKQGYTKEVRSVYNRRIVEYTKRGLEDLALLGENLPEDQLAEIFNKEAFMRLARAVFRLRIKPDMNEKDLHKRRKRILKLSYVTLTEIGILSNAWALAPNVMRVLTKAGLSDIDVIIGLKAIYIQSLSEE